MTTGVPIHPGRKNIRRLNLHGAINFRDLGGYRTTDGRSVKWRHLFRSDSLAALTGNDLDIIAGLGLRNVIDLREASERAKHPSIELPASVRTFQSFGFLPAGGEQLMDGIKEKSISPAEANRILKDMYRHFPLSHHEVYAQVLKTLLAPTAIPALVHCTSGKDRTGFAVAVLLMALGVPRPTILEDYLLTNQHRRDLTFLLGDSVAPELLDVVTQAHPEYLNAAFNAINETWGSDQAFLETALGLDEDSQRELQRRLLEPPG